MSEFWKRTVFGTLFLLVMVGCLLWSRYSFEILMIAVMVLCIDEFHKLAVGDDFRIQKWLVLACGLVIFITMEGICKGIMPVSCIALAMIPVLAIPVSFVFGWKHLQMDKLAYIYSELVYIALPVGLSPYLVYRGGEYSGLLLLSLYIIIWVSDVGAYCLGTAFGQKEGARKMAPDISPKKSWWGFWGSVILGTASGAVLNVCGLIDFPMLHCLGIAAVISCSCVLGDLVESLWKRHSGVKDSGKLIPGHGGALDRFDSSLISIPLASMYIFIFNLI